MVQKRPLFVLIEEFCLWVKLHLEGSAINKPTLSSFTLTSNNAETRIGNWINCTNASFKLKIKSKARRKRRMRRMKKKKRGDIGEAEARK